jgi:Chlorophyll A-B binding protein
MTTLFLNIKKLGFFDPMGLLKDATQERFDRLRLVEIKHGRIAMMAVAGYLTTAAGVRFPGDLAYGVPFTDIPSGLAAFPAMPVNGVIQILAFIMILEMGMRDMTGKNEFIGDWRNGHIDFGWDKLSPEVKLKKRAIELNNGRAAMMGIWALVTHEYIGVPILPSL